MEAVVYITKDYQGEEHTILCVRSELEEHKKANPPAERKQPARQAAQEPAPESTAPEAPEKQVEEKKEEKELKIGEKLEILDQTKDFQETLDTLNQPVSGAANLLKQEAPKEQPDAAAQSAEPVRTDTKLSGTPLTHAPLKTSVAQPKNKLQEVIYSQCRVSRNDPPTEELPTGTAMREVTNPVVEACRAMRLAWSSTTNRDQLTDFLISLDGMIAKMEPKTRRTMGTTNLQKAIQTHLQDLEAERLALLVQLDRAKADQEEYRKQAVSEAGGKTARELKQKEAELEKLKQSLAALQEENNCLTKTREQLVSEVQNLREAGTQEAERLLTQLGMTLPMAETSLRMVPRCGECLDEKALLKRIELACRNVNYDFDRNRGLAIILAMAICRRMGISTETPAPMITMMKNLADQLGWSQSMAVQTDRDQRPVLVEAPANATPAVLISMLQSYAAVPGMCKIIMTKTAQMQCGTAAYAAGQWPVYIAPSMRNVLPVDAGNTVPVAAASVAVLLDAQPGVERDTVISVLSPMLSLIAPLGGEAINDVCRFVSAATGVMEGGLVSACDWAIALWVMPALPRNSALVEKARLLLAEYPVSLGLLG